MEFRGIKTYIDPRAELFVKKYNKKYDIFDEFQMISGGNPSDEYIKYFLKKYNFTHIIVNYDKTFERFLRNSDNYYSEYTRYFDTNKELPDRILYVRKDISIKKGDIKDEKEK